MTSSHVDLLDELFVFYGIYLIGGSMGLEGRDPGPKFLHCYAVFRENWPSNRLVPPSGVGAPLENPGSATVSSKKELQHS